MWLCALWPWKQGWSGGCDSTGPEPARQRQAVLESLPAVSLLTFHSHPECSRRSFPMCSDNDPICSFDEIFEEALRKKKSY